jgi:hypothetical protein
VIGLDVLAGLALVDDLVLEVRTVFRSMDESSCAASMKTMLANVLIQRVVNWKLL